jgi:hypothetical protein
VFFFSKEQRRSQYSGISVGVTIELGRRARGVEGRVDGGGCNVVVCRLNSDLFECGWDGGCGWGFGDGGWAAG